MKVTFDLPFDPEAPYTVIDTDYENYSIVHSCDVALGIYKYDLVWVLTRQAFPKTSTSFNKMKSTVIKAMVDSFKADKPYFSKYIDTNDYLLAPI